MQSSPPPPNCLPPPLPPLPSSYTPTPKSTLTITYSSPPQVPPPPPRPLRRMLSSPTPPPIHPSPLSHMTSPPTLVPRPSPTSPPPPPPHPLIRRMESLSNMPTTAMEMVDSSVPPEPPPRPLSTLRSPPRPPPNRSRPQHKEPIFSRDSSLEPPQTPDTTSPQDSLLLRRSHSLPFEQKSPVLSLPPPQRRVSLSPKSPTKSPPLPPRPTPPPTPLSPIPLSPYLESPLQPPFILSEESRMSPVLSTPPSTPSPQLIAAMNKHKILIPTSQIDIHLPPKPPKRAQFPPTATTTHQIQFTKSPSVTSPHIQICTAPQPMLPPPKSPKARIMTSPLQLRRSLSSTITHLTSPEYSLSPLSQRTIALIQQRQQQKELSKMKKYDEHSF